MKLTHWLTHFLIHLPTVWQVYLLGDAITFKNTQKVYLRKQTGSTHRSRAEEFLDRVKWKFLLESQELSSEISSKFVKTESEVKIIDAGQPGNFMHYQKCPFIANL